MDTIEGPVSEWKYWPDWFGPEAVLWHRRRESVFVVMIPQRARSLEAESEIPISVRHRLFLHPLAPVIRSRIKVFKHEPVVLDVYTNIADPNERKRVKHLAAQSTLSFDMYARELRHGLRLHRRNLNVDGLITIVKNAESWGKDIPPIRYDFDRAKADVERWTTRAGMHPSRSLFMHVPETTPLVFSRNRKQ